MITKEVSSFCLDCPHLNGLCEGNFNDVYSGCVWKAADAESFRSFLEDVNGNDDQASVDQDKQGVKS